MHTLDSLTEQQKNEIIEKYIKAETSISVLAKSYGFHKDCIIRFIKKRGIKFRGQKFSKFNKENELIDGFKAGEKLVDLIKRLGCSIGLASEIINRNHLRTKNEISSRIDSVKEQIIKDYLEGKRVKLIAKEHSMTSGSLYNYLHKWNITVFDKNFARIERIVEKEKYNMAKLYTEERLNTREIAAIYNVSYGVILRVLKSLGVKMKLPTHNVGSAVERKFESILKDFNIEYQKQYRLEKKFFDFFIPKKNLLIEVNGDYWHGNRKIYKKLDQKQIEGKRRDRQKREIAWRNKMDLIFIWEYQLNNEIDKVLRKLKKFGISGNLNQENQALATEQALAVA